MLVKMNCSSNEGEISAPELLWTNSDLTTGQASYEITVPEYDGYIVLVQGYTTPYNSQGYVFNYVPNYDVSEMCTESNGYWAGITGAFKVTDSRFPNMVQYGRNITYSNGTITIGGTSAGNPYSIPVKIWGINGKLEV